MKKLAEILAEIDDAEEMELFLAEILTPKEFSDLGMRWQLLIELHEGKTQRSIAGRHGISLCKITRGSKILKKKDAVTLKLLQRLYGGEKSK